MNKITLDTFIQKYNLGGNVNSVTWNSTGDTLSTDFISPDKSLRGQLVLSKQNLPEFKVGVYDTPLLSKMLGTLSDNIDFTLITSPSDDETPVAFHLNDSVISADYVLAAVGVIPDVPELKNVPEFNTLVNIDSQFISSFIRGKGALADVDTFTVVNNKGSMELVIGYSSMNTNRVTIPVKCEGTLTDNVSFSAKYFKDVLVANKECGSATLEVSSKGLSRINFKVDDYDVTYFMVAIDEVD